MITLESMHDATLKGFTVDWVTGDLRFNFAILKEEKKVARIIAAGLRNIDCPRKSPWGRSFSVNSIFEQKIEDAILLTIEMQSGDIIKALITEFRLEAE